MSTPVPLPLGLYSLPDPRAGSRRMVNCFVQDQPQVSPADSKQKIPPVVLRRAQGVSGFASDGTTNGTRGMWMMQGVLYAVIGPVLYTVSATGALAQVATGIGGGNSIVRMSDNTACLVIILPGTYTGYTYVPGTGLAPITDETFTSLGAIDLGFLDTYIVFLAVNGRENYTSDSQEVSGQGPITFTAGTEFPREYGTDAFVGLSIDHREVIAFGERTTEGYIDAGNQTNSPLASAPDTFMEIGALPGTSLAVAKQDQGVFWIANDRTVRRKNGQTPVRVSDYGIEAILAKANVTGCYALVYPDSGHLMYAITLPAVGRTLVYDCNTQQWHELASPISAGSGVHGQWRPSCIYNAFGKWLVGDSQSGQIGVLDSTVSTEFAANRNSIFTTQSVYDGNNRISHRRLELVMGGGLGNSSAVNPQVTLKVSDDGGKTYRTLPLRSLGAQGEYSQRAVWNNCGMARQRVYQFEVSDAVPMWAPDITAELQGGRW